ncbi:hypothetical protein [Teredinibacter franksiae]|uniref:hypothetical protein n=1 Tax=Teredinibacter franksiae TaxID=2761453 RepID=UPI0016235AAA|nr:hypothetical protein [Teredinibacter franksiae]
MFNRVMNISTVSIIDDGVIIESEWANGRPIPAIIVNADRRPDIIEYINAHKNQPPGDVVVQWATALCSKKKISLVIKSSRPVSLEFAIEIDANKHHALIDGVMRNNGFYLLEGKAGDKVSTLISNQSGRIIIEVPATGFEQIWEGILKKIIEKRFKKQGLSRKGVINATSDYIKSMREFWQLRKNT